eukprot:1158262-Pelagomonas_calceolata.AAC.3
MVHKFFRVKVCTRPAASPVLCFYAPVLLCSAPVLLCFYAPVLVCSAPEWAHRRAAPPQLKPWTKKSDTG